jgi:hypothetical protein
MALPAWVSAADADAGAVAVTGAAPALAHRSRAAVASTPVLKNGFIVFEVLVKNQ